MIFKNVNVGDYVCHHYQCEDTYEITMDRVTKVTRDYITVADHGSFSRYSGQPVGPCGGGGRLKVKTMLTPNVTFTYQPEFPYEALGMDSTRSGDSHFIFAGVKPNGN